MLRGNPTSLQEHMLTISCKAPHYSKKVLFQNLENGRRKTAATAAVKVGRDKRAQHELYGNLDDAPSNDSWKASRTIGGGAGSANGGPSNWRGSLSGLS